MGELQSKPVVTPNPFGTPPPPWYKGRAGGAPSRQARTVAFATGLIAVMAQGQIHGWLDKTAFFLLVIAGPGWALERWWRARRRRGSEELLPDWLSAPPPTPRRR